MSFDLSPKLSLERHRERVKRELSSHRTLLVIANQEVAGYLVFRVSEDKDNASAVVELHRLYVKPSFRRKGVAKISIALLTETYLPSPAQVFLSVNIENERARAFYRSVGFEEVFVTMKKSLNGGG